MKFWQVIGDRRYRREFTTDGDVWTAVLTWRRDAGDGVAADGRWLLQFGPGAPRDLDVEPVGRNVSFRPADLDRSTPTPPYLRDDAEAMEVQHALHTAERYVEAHLDGRFERLDR